MDQLFRTVTVVVVQGHRSTIAEALAVTHEGEIRSTGEALRHPTDKDDPSIGTDLAVGRALESLSAKLLRRANGRVRMHDHNRRHRITVENDPRCIAANKGNGSRCQRDAVYDNGLCGPHNARLQRGEPLTSVMDGETP